MLRQGFTLIELMVVLAVVGIIVGVAVLFIRPASPAEVRRQAAEELWAVSRAARDEAIMRRRTLGMHLDTDSYQVVGRNGAVWSSPEGDPFYRERSLPFGLEIHITRGENEEHQAEPEQEEPPQLVFSPDGEVSDFELSISGRDAKGSTWVYTDEHDEIRLR